MLGDSDSVQVGDQVAAIGNPLGLDRSITLGIVSALHRSLTSPEGTPIDRVIQTDAALNHGNSGGPLLNAQGQVVGVSSAISTGDTGGEGNIGIGFAIPINTVSDVVAELKAQGHVDHPYLGVVTRPVSATMARIFNLPVDRGCSSRAWPPEVAQIGRVCAAAPTRSWSKARATSSAAT